MHDIYPVTIVADRYNGTYSHGKYTAWNKYPEGVPEEIFQDDITANIFFHECKETYGCGSTPDQALNDLRNKIVI